MTDDFWALDADCLFWQLIRYVVSVHCWSFIFCWHWILQQSQWWQSETVCIRVCCRFVQFQGRLTACHCLRELFLFCLETVTTTYTPNIEALLFYQVWTICIVLDDDEWLLNICRSLRSILSCVGLFSCCVVNKLTLLLVITHLKANKLNDMSTNNVEYIKPWNKDGKS